MGAWRSGVHVPAHARNKKKKKKGQSEWHHLYNYGWQKKRIAFLARPENVICAICNSELSTVVDHIVPHKGDLTRFHDDDNIQGVCVHCHNIKTVVEDGGLGNDVAVNWHPDFFAPSLIRLHIVCGATASGKSTYVRACTEHEGFHKVIDLDEILNEILDKAGSTDRLKYLNFAGRLRNAEIAKLSKPNHVSRYDTAYLIVSEPHDHLRQWWDDTLKPASITVLETNENVCKERILDDPDRDDEQVKQVFDWWRNYSRRDGDRVIENMW